MPDENENITYEEMPLSKIREIAKEKGIKNISEKNKAHLIKELEEGEDK